MLHGEAVIRARHAAGSPFAAGFYNHLPLNQTVCGTRVCGEGTARRTLSVTRDLGVKSLEKYQIYVEAIR